MNRLENDKYMDKHDKAQQKILEADERKQDIHHYDGVGCTIPAGRSAVIYVLKAYVGSDHPNWDEIFQTCEEPWNLEQVVLGIYSRGEQKEATAHGERHTERTGETYGIMETFISL